MGAKRLICPSKACGYCYQHHMPSVYNGYGIYPLPDTSASGKADVSGSGYTMGLVASEYEFRLFVPLINRRYAHGFLIGT